MRLLCRCVLALALVLPGLSAAAQRIVTLGGTVTEIVFDLGRGQDLVAVDQSSLYPPQVKNLPNVGYYRQLAIEGVAAMLPDVVLASENAGPAQALARLRALGIHVRTVSDSGTVDSLYQRIETLAEILGREQQGYELVARIREQLQQMDSLDAQPFWAAVLIYRAGQFQLAGEDTSAHHVLELAGLRNIQQTQRSYMNVSTEGLAALDPEMIVITQSSLASVGGMQAFLRLPGIVLTKAARAQRIVVMDDLLILGIGPRVAQAVRQLKQAAL